jgi:hypothetical protein
MANVANAVKDYQRLSGGETFGEVYGGSNGRNQQTHNGNGKQTGKRYETASARRARETEELLAELDALAEQARIDNEGAVIDLTYSREPQASGLAPVRR